MDRHTAPRDQKAWTLISTPVDSDKVVEREGVQCAHCGRIWVWQPGSGRRRGWCLGCHNFTCGSPRCDVCVPQEQQLENLEAGRDLLFRPVRGRVAGDVPGG